MFTGIVEETGKLASISDTKDGRRLAINCKSVLAGTRTGDSIAVSGCCLTVVSMDSTSFSADASLETLKKTRLGKLSTGSPVNLERAMRLSDRLGGHLVSGHVDGLAILVARRAEGFSTIMEFETESSHANYFIEKGSVALDGISLTLFNLKDGKDKVRFSIAVIPHTLEATTLKEIKVGDAVNLETDLIGKYVARWLSGGPQNLNEILNENINKDGVTMSFLQDHGYT